MRVDGFMRIGYLINQYPKVSHTFIRREIAAVEAQGVEVCLFAIRNSGDELLDPADQRELTRTRWIVKATLTEIVLAILGAMINPSRLLATIALTWQVKSESNTSFFKNLAYLVEAMILRRWCEAERLPHIHAHFGTNATTVVMLCRSLGGPTFSFTVHGPEEFDRPLALGLGEKIHRAAFVVAISEFGRSQLLRWCEPADWSKIHVVRCGLEQSDLEHMATLPSGNRLTIVGRLSVEKGHPILLEALKKLADEIIDFELVVVGGGPMQQSLADMVNDLNLSDRVKFVGYQSGPEVRRWIESSRAMVLPSFAEGLPVVLMESLAMGRPVIATYIAGTPELIKPGINGWLVPAGSVDALASAIREVLSLAPERLLEMGKKGQESIRMMHSMPTEAGKLCERFREAVRNGQSCEVSDGVGSASLQPALTSKA